MGLLLLLVLLVDVSVTSHTASGPLCADSPVPVCPSCVPCVVVINLAPTHPPTHSSSKVDEVTGKPNQVPTVSLTSNAGWKANINIFNVFVGKVGGGVGWGG